MERLLCCALLPAATPGIAHAEWYGELRLVSDYVERGYTRSRGNPVLQAGLEFHSLRGWQAGARASRVRFDQSGRVDRASLEFAPFVGFGWSLKPDWHAGVRVTGYLYDEKLYYRHANYAEFSATLDYRDLLSARLAVAPDVYGSGGTNAAAELELRHDLLERLQWSAAVGYHLADSLLERDYAYWNSGFTLFVSSRMAIDARYSDLSIGRYAPAGPYYHARYPDLQKRRLLFTLTLGF